MSIPLARWRIQWNGITGAPGVSTFYTQASVSTDWGPQFRTFFNSIKGNLPTSLTLVFPSSYDVIDDGDGHLISTTSVTPQASLAGTGGGSYSAASGLCVTWRTNAVAKKHRLVGRTFIVPTDNFAYDTAGTVFDTYKATVTTAAQALITAIGTAFVVWSRPKGPKGGPPTTPGTSSPVVAAVVNDKVAILRSRRD